jgi:hypothetical protein
VFCLDLRPDQVTMFDTGSCMFVPFQQRDTAQIPSCRITTPEQRVLLSVSGLLRDDRWGCQHHSKIFQNLKTKILSAAGRSDQLREQADAMRSKKQPASPIILHTLLGLRWFQHDISRGEVAVLYHATRRETVLCWYDLDGSS